MTSRVSKLGRAVSTGAVAIVLALMAVLPAMSSDDSATLSKKEVKQLLARSEDPVAQQRLAAYYKDKAQRLNAKSQQFAQQADSLATQPATIESKQGISCNCTSHYRYFSKLYAREAAEAQRQAEQHEQLAQTHLDNTAAQK